MASVKEIKRRIKAVSNIGQITKAMELVSVVKMQKAVSANLSTRGYSDLAGRMLKEILPDIKPEEHGYLRPNGGNRSLIVVVTSDRGLCGSLNSKVISSAIQHAKEKEAEFLVIGKKGGDYLARHGFNVLAHFAGLTEKPTFQEIYPIVKVITDEYKSGTVKEVDIFYTHFESSLSQVPSHLRLLPIALKVPEEETVKQNASDYVFEPSRKAVIESIIPRILEITIWQSFLESVASEHSARMFAMKNASDNANDLLGDLTLNYNYARQSGITRELAEISAGKMTIEE